MKTVTDEEVLKLRAKKVPAAQNEVRVAATALRLIEERSVGLSQEDYDIWNKSVYWPARRRHAKACQTLMFWQEVEDVKAWLEGRQPQMKALADVIERVMPIKS